MLSTPSFDPGSFRDRESRVVVDGDRVVRLLSAGGKRSFDAYDESGLRSRLEEEGLVVGSRPCEVPPAFSESWSAALEHERIPLVTYPYEWPYELLRDAALLQLKLVRRATSAGLAVKDSSAFNVQLVRGKVQFIDVGSFEPRVKGDPWAGYFQFCRMFLFPLMITAFRELPHQPLMRADLEGVSLELARALFPRIRDLAKPGVFKDVVLQSKAQTLIKGSGGKGARANLREAGFADELILANVRRLEKIVEGLPGFGVKTSWSEYATDNTYSDESSQKKKQFVARFLEGARADSVCWDLGCNTGVYSLMAAERCATVVAVDGDPGCIDRLYQEIKRQKLENLYPVCMSLTDPSPGLGWRGEERTPITLRSRPDMLLCLALIHHIVIGANVPLASFIGWIVTLEADLVIEFVDKSDPMVQGLLQNKRDVYDDYSLENLVSQLERHFTVVERLNLPDGHRTLLQCHRTNS